ncbi:MAG: hypothetical protein AB1626_04580 [Candidatus Micrarchaeota archaeon]
MPEELESHVFSVTPGERITVVHRTEKGPRQMKLQVHGTLEKALEKKKLSAEAVAALNHPLLSLGLVKGLVIGLVPETTHVAVIGSMYGAGGKKDEPVYSVGSIHPLIAPAERAAQAKALLTTIIREAYSCGKVLFPEIIKKK